MSYLDNPGVQSEIHELKKSEGLDLTESEKQQLDGVLEVWENTFTRILRNKDDDRTKLQLFLNEYEDMRRRFPLILANRIEKYDTVFRQLHNAFEQARKAIDSQSPHAQQGLARLLVELQNILSGLNGKKISSYASS